MESLVLTRAELVELVEQIASEVVREVASSTSPQAQPAAKREPSSGETAAQVSQVRPAGAGATSKTTDLRGLAALFDHTLLRPQATRAEVEGVCREARQVGFAAVCVNPVWVPLIARELRGSLVKVVTVAGFPLGATTTSAKRAETRAAILAGAQEIDMVMNVGAMKSGELDRMEDDVRGVLEVCRAGGARLKVILENAYLSDEEKVSACRIVQKAGADFVKTSTGFGPSGATEGDVRLMRETVGPDMGVKAAGGIRTLAEALRMLEAGASRLGSSRSVEILAEAAHLVN